MGFYSSKFEKAISSLYNDCFSIWDHVKRVDAFGITQSELQEVDTNIFCKISYPSQNSPDSGTIDINPIDWDSVNVKKGQLITAYRKNGQGETLAEYKGLVNEARLYGSHLELKIKFEGVA